jgi:hypothetical protein
MTAIHILMMLVFAGAGAYQLGRWYLSEARTVRRALRATPASTIAALPEGQPGRIVGRVAPGATLEAPLSGRACVYVEVTVEEQRGDRPWELMIREIGSVAFTLEDGTGRALVEPGSARVSLQVDFQGSSGTLDDPDDRELQLLHRHGQDSAGLLFNRKLRYSEAVIEIGETVAVFGIGVREPDPDGGAGALYRDGPPTRVRMNGSPRFPLLISDRPDTQHA